MTTDLRELLELASDGLPETDLAAAAWAQAREQHRRVVRRTVLGAGAATVAAVVVGAVVQERAPDRLDLDRADALPTASEAGLLPSVEVGGVSVFLAPDPVDEARLPRYPRSAALAIPRHLGPGDPDTRAVLGVDGVWGVAEPVRGVFLVTADAGALSPVVFAPAAPSPYVLFPTVRVTQMPGTSSALSARAIADDRHRVVMAQPARLVLLDARDGSVRAVPVPDPTLSLAGWARDGITVVARGRDDGWLVEPDTGVVRRADGPVEPDWFDLADAGGWVELRTFSGAGELTGARRMRGPAVVPNGACVSNTEGWVARGAFLPGDFQDDVLRSQGLVAVQNDVRPTPRILAATTSVLVPKNSYRALTWGPSDTVVFESRSERPGFQGTVRRVLAWDVIGGRLWQVADVDRAGRGVGDFAGSYTL